MQDVHQIEMDRFDYPLPDAQIAKYPLAQRDQSRLLCYREGQISEYRFDQLPQLLPPGGLMLFNNTKVIHARLLFRKPSGARIELFCLEPVAPADYALVFQTTQSCEWRCIVGNAKRWKEGPIELPIPQANTSLVAHRVANEAEGVVRIRFEWPASEASFGQLLAWAGEIPIPPYLNRRAEAIDTHSYQTRYSKHEGSVAAPTAGLHFTDAVLAAIDQRGILRSELTLHVGAGTFKPVKTDRIGGHDMHTEHFSFATEQLPLLRQHLGQLTVVGTTSLRSLESIYWLGQQVLAQPHLAPHQLLVPQWLPYQNQPTPSAHEALDALYQWALGHGLERVQARTQILIAPSYRFRLARVLITNFHQPRSTLLLLVSAFVGDDWQRIYQHALAQGFRFLSYGDSSILFLPTVQHV